MCPPLPWASRTSRMYGSVPSHFHPSIPVSRTYTSHERKRLSIRECRGRGIAYHLLPLGTCHWWQPHARLLYNCLLSVAVDCKHSKSSLHALNTKCSAVQSLPYTYKSTITSKLSIGKLYARLVAAQLKEVHKLMLE